jgi:hypothetical protein
VAGFRAVFLAGFRAAVVRLDVVRLRAGDFLLAVDFRVVFRLAVDFRPVVFRRLAVDFRPVVFRLAVDFLPVVFRLAVDFRPVVFRLVVFLVPVFFRAVAMVTSLLRSGRHALQASTFPLAHASPHAIALVATQRVVETLDPDLALRADALRFSRGTALLGEEDLRVEVPAP